MIRWLGLLLLSILALAAPIPLLLALPFARRQTSPILPRWLAWLNTPDDPGPSQGMYEPQVLAVYNRFGWYVKTWYWLGWRNQLYGLFASLSAKYDGAPVRVSDRLGFRIYSVPRFMEITWPRRRVSFGYKVHTLSTAKIGDPIWWVLMPAFWKSREY